MHGSPPMWFLVSGLLAVFVSHCIRAGRLQLALRRSLARARAVAAAPGSPIAVRVHA